MVSGLGSTAVQSAGTVVRSGAPSAVIWATSRSPARTPSGREIATSVTAVVLDALLEARAEMPLACTGAALTTTVAEACVLPPLFAALIVTVYEPGAL